MIFNEDVDVVDVVDNDGVNSISNSTFLNFGRTTSLDGTKTLLPPNDTMPSWHATLCRLRVPFPMFNWWFVHKNFSQALEWPGFCRTQTTN